MAHDVFISYSHIDKQIADAMCHLLESHGIKCWYAPRDAMPGAPWATEINNAIAACRVFVLVLTGHSNESDQVLREVNLATKNKLHIITFKASDVDLNKSFEYYLGTSHWLEAVSPPLMQHLEYLLETVCRCLDKPAPATDTQTSTTVSVTPQSRKVRRFAVPVAVGSGVVAIAAIGLLLTRPFSAATLGPSPSASAIATAAAVTTAPAAMPATPSPSPSATTAPDFYRTPAGNNFVDANDDWVVYAAPVGKGLFHMKNDGTERAMLNDDECGCINIIGDWVYYTNYSDDEKIYRVKIDGTSRQKINNDSCYYLVAVGNQLFYQCRNESDRIYCIGLDGKNRQPVGDRRASNLMVLEDHFYYISEDDHMLYYFRLGDANGHKVFNIPVTEIHRAGTWVYTVLANDNMLYRVSINGGTLKQLYDGEVRAVQAYGDAVYFISSNRYSQIVQIQVDGTKPKTVVEEPVNRYNIVGGWIYYAPESLTDFKSLYRVRIDGTGKQQLIQATNK